MMHRFYSKQLQQTAKLPSVFLLHSSDDLQVLLYQDFPYTVRWTELYSSCTELLEQPTHTML